MNTILLAAALIALSATAVSADCIAIRDYDRGQACAEQRQSPEGCTSIKDWDDRERCRQRAGQRDLFGQSMSRDRSWPR